MSQDFFAELQQEFLTESLFMMEQYEEGMLQLEGQDVSDEVMAQIFRVAHSIKGGAAAVGFQDLAGFAHVAEDLLSLLRLQPQLVNPDVISLLLESGDVFRNRLTELQGGNPGPWDTTELKTRLVDMTTKLGGTGGHPAEHSDQSAAEAPSIVETPNMAETPNQEPVALESSSADFMSESASVAGVELAAVPSPAQSSTTTESEDHCNHELLAELMAQMGGDNETPESATPKAVAEAPAASSASAPAKATPAATVAAAVKTAPVAAKASGGSAPASGGGGGKPKSAAAAVSSIKVDTTRVESVLDAVGEIVVLKNQLVHDELVQNGENPRISGIVDQLDKLVRELYDKTLSIRMTPLKSLFVKIQRLVRDVSLQLGKPVNLTLQGEETEVERTVFEILGDPLVHLVRNSMDHGIEKPELRKEKGKPNVASVVVSAKQVGGTVVIEITDDGGGISREKVLMKAIEKNLIPTGRDPESLRDEEVFQFIFAPGFSTAEKITDLSGRGVGLDVVRTNLEKIHGKLDIQSKKDVGTTFRLSIPLSTAITDGILVAAQGARYILPIYSIREIVRVVPDDYTNISDMGKVVKIRESLIPVIDAEKVLGRIDQKKLINKTTDHSDVEEAQSLRSRRGETMLIIIESVQGQVAFPVDRVLGQSQVVVKPLQAGSDIPEVSGAAILGDGRTVLILDPQALVKPRSTSSTAESQSEAA